MGSSLGRSSCRTSQRAATARTTAWAVSLVADLDLDETPVGLDDSLI
jgi:hypothetical protein